MNKDMCLLFGRSCFGKSCVTPTEPYVFSLQPRNIFLQSGSEEEHTSLQVKIGDFGLARKEVVISPGDSSPLASLIEPLTPLFPPGKMLYLSLWLQYNTIPFSW